MLSVAFKPLHRCNSAENFVSRKYRGDNYYIKRKENCALFLNDIKSQATGPYTAHHHSGFVGQNGELCCCSERVATCSTRIEIYILAQGMSVKWRFSTFDLE